MARLISSVVLDFPAIHVAHKIWVIDLISCFFFFFQAEDGIRDSSVTGVQTCALPISQQESRSRIAAYRAWEPQVYVDFHEMGTDSSYFFPPAADPVHPRIDRRVIS